ncbi:MAG: nucleoside-diphosphate sugar epimerase/dehydratase, partial [Pseudomonadota bacterium]
RLVRSANGADLRRVAIYGSGDAGVQVSAALSGGSMFKPVAFIDDNPAIEGNYIEGLRVYPFSHLAQLIKKHQVNEVIIALPSVERSRRSEIIKKLEPYSVHVSILPDLDDLASGRVKVEDIREVGVRDLLAREPVEPDVNLLESNVRDKIVLVTGAGGSIGSELCRQIIRIGPSKLILYERGEHDLYVVEKELLQLLARKGLTSEISQNMVIPVLASILDQERLESVCKAFKVDTIYHAAAYKHVPMVERNPLEAVRNNVIGSYKSAMAAINSSVETFVLVSTDKAVRPTNTMGATKRFAEMILQGLAARGLNQTRFTMVRFGNVLDSSGSVVPLFREQIKRGGPVTVTDPKITRFFMTIPEAAQLVIQAGAMGRGGDVFVLDMGNPVKILELARRMIHLSGLAVKDSDNPMGDIEIEFTGLRPGEKLYEELLIGDNVEPTAHPLIMTANEDCLSWQELTGFLAQFVETIKSNDVDQGRSLLVQSVKGFEPQCDVVDLVQEKSRMSDSQSQSNIIKYPGILE